MLGHYDYTDVDESKQGNSAIKCNQDYSGSSQSKGHDPNAQCSICQQKYMKRFMVSCLTCHEYFHGDCVGVSEADGCKDFTCSPCAEKPINHHQSECNPQTEPEISPVCLSLSLSGQQPEDKQELKSQKTVEGELKANDIEEVLTVETESKPEIALDMETNCSRPLCIGPGCSNPAIQDSVYCGNDCIVQHAALTMKSLSDPKVQNARGQVQRKTTSITPAAKGQSSSRGSAKLAAKVAESLKEEELMETDAKQTAATAALDRDPTVTEVQATPQPSKFYTTSSKECIYKETESNPKLKSEDPSAEEHPLLQPVSELVVSKSNPQDSTKESNKSDTLIRRSEKPDHLIPNIKTKSGPSPASQSSKTLKSEHRETASVSMSLTPFIIPKKQSGIQPPLSHMVPSCQKSSVPTILNETRNLPVPPAPSAPPSRPSQPNNQVRQSIQRSLTSILSKRVCECEDLAMSESDAVKLVASIETEMFDIFRNTDSKYMNKYRTIMFNLKDPKNKGLLYRVVQGDISPFRLVRMSQKDMQATKVPDQYLKDTSEVKNAATKAPSLMPVKVDLSCLNVTKPERTPMGNKRNLSTLTVSLKNKMSEPSRGSTIPDVLSRMLKDTTSQHKAHLFDLKCKICTGQIREEEPPNKINKVSESGDKPSSRQSKGNDLHLRASPDSDYLSSTFDPSSRLVIDTRDFAINESPASPIKDSPASPILESPASPVMESPKSPISGASKITSKQIYTPVVIPTVSTVTITRRDPRTAASRNSASSRSTSVPINTQSQSASYATFTEGSSSTSVSKLPLPPPKPLPKPILMKPSSSADPRFYNTSSRNVISESPANGETSQFLAKQEILWKGFLSMFTVSKFVTKGYLVSGSAEILKSELPDTIEIGGRIMPQTVWEYIARLKTNITKELCVIRFHPSSEEEEVAYVSLFSYFSSRGRFGVVSNKSPLIKDIYLVPLSAKESIPSILQPLEGQGLEKNRPNILLGLAIVQKTKRSGSALQEMEEKKLKCFAKDPLWIPKPPALYGSEKSEVFKPYDPETSASTPTPLSPTCPGSPSEFSSKPEMIPSQLASMKSDPAVSTSVSTASIHPSIHPSIQYSSNISESNTKAPGFTPLSTILNTLFKNKQSNVMVSNEKHCTENVTTVSAKVSVFSHVSKSMMDPIVQQYGQISKAKDREEDYTLDRPYDPEEAYDPAIEFKTVSSQSKRKKSEDPPLSSTVDDDVAYDPEDETMFQDVQCDGMKRNPTKMLNSPAQSFPIPTHVDSPFSKTSSQSSTPVAALQNLPTGTVVISAATLTEQQRMLEELNKQIEEQKQQLKEQEEALRQQKEAVGMFMAQFSGNDPKMCLQSKSLPLSQGSPNQSGLHSEPLGSNDPETVETSNLTGGLDAFGREPVKQDNIMITSVKNIDEESADLKESEKSSAGEIEDSDTPYDLDDDVLNAIQGDPGTKKNRNSSLSKSPISNYSRRRRSSPKRRSHREREHCRSPSRRSQHRSVSRSRRHRGKDRHRKSEKDRSTHRSRDHPERQAHHRKSHSLRRHSRDRRRSPSYVTENFSVPNAQKELKASCDITENEMHVTLNCQLNPDVVRSSSTISFPSLTKNNTGDKHNFKSGSAEKDISPENFPISKIETSQHSNYNELLENKDRVIGNNDNDFPHAIKQQGTGGDKFESPIPLREIDPPIRDSPESPDPDPRFIKPSSVENNPSAKSDEIIDCETQVNQMRPDAKVEKKSQECEGNSLDRNDLEKQCQGSVPLISATKIGPSIASLMGLGQKCSKPGRDPIKDIEVPNLKVEDNKSYLGQPASMISSMDNGDIQIEGIAVDFTIKCSDPSKESKGYLPVKDFQQHRSDLKSIENSNLKSSLKTKTDRCTTQTLSEETYTIEKFSKTEEASMGRPALSINYRQFESNAFCTGLENVGSAIFFQESQYDVNFQQHRKYDVREVSSLGPGQVVNCMGGKSFIGAFESHVPDRAIGESTADSSYAFQEGNKHGQGPERATTNMEIHVPNRIEACKPQFEMGVQNLGFSNDDSRRQGGLNVIGPRGRNMYTGVPGHNRSKPDGPYFTGVRFRGPNMRNWNGPERLYTDMRITMHGKTGVCDFRTREWNTGNPDMADSVLGNKPMPPDFSKPLSEKKQPAVNKVPYGMREPGGPHQLSSHFESGLGKESPAHERGGARVEEGLAREQGHDRKKHTMESSRFDTKGLVVSQFGGEENTRRILFNCPERNRNKSGFPDLGGLEPKKELGRTFFTAPGDERNNRWEHDFARHTIEDHATSAPWGEQNTNDLAFDRLRPDRPAWDHEIESQTESQEFDSYDWRGPDIKGPGPARDNPGSVNTKHQLFMEHRIVEEDGRLGPNTECPGPEIRLPDRQEKVYGSGLSDTRVTEHPFGGQGPDKILPKMMGPERNWKDPHFRAERKGPASEDFIGPIYENRNPGFEVFGHDRQKTKDIDLRNVNFEKDPREPSPNWRENARPFIGSEDRQDNRLGPDNREDQRMGRRFDIEDEEFIESEALFDDLGRNFNVSMPMRRYCRRRYPASDRRGSDIQKHWLARHKTQLKNEWNHPDSRYSWRNSEAIEAPCFEYNEVGPCTDQRGPEMRDERVRPDFTPMPFTGPRRVSQDNWCGPGSRDTKPFQGHVDLGGPRCDREGPENSFGETDQRDVESRWGSENMGCRKGNERVVPPIGVGVQDLKHSRITRGPSMERSGAEKRIRGCKMFFQNRREGEMQDICNQRRRRDIDLRNHENPYRGRRVNDTKKFHQTERDSIDINSPIPGSSEPYFRMQDPDMRRFNDKTDIRGPAGPTEWDTSTEIEKMGSDLDTREPDPAMKESMELSHMRGSRRYNRQGFYIRGRRPIRRSRGFRGLMRGHRGSAENPNSQQEINTPKSRSALLPTPAEGRIC
ncbi:uncharacterized protein LOC144194458 isoform X2 [Stigmatopora nigra]